MRAISKWSEWADGVLAGAVDAEPDEVLALLDRQTEPWLLSFRDKP
jgi:hypothetical protein